MSLQVYDTSAILTNIEDVTQAGAAIGVAILTCLLLIKTAKWLRGALDDDGDDDLPERCEGCGEYEFCAAHTPMGSPICEGCYYDYLCRRCGDVLVEDPEYRICEGCER